MRKITVLILALLLTLSFAVQAGSEGRQNLKKEAIENSRLPDFTSIFNWGLKLTNFKELYLFAGIAAQQSDFSIVAPGDYVAQTDFILTEFDVFLAENELDRDDLFLAVFDVELERPVDDVGWIRRSQAVVDDAVVLVRGIPANSSTRHPRQHHHQHHHRDHRCAHVIVLTGATIFPRAANGASHKKSRPDAAMRASF